jgi:hypothetical protein
MSELEDDDEARALRDELDDAIAALEDAESAE